MSAKWPMNSGWIRSVSCCLMCLKLASERAWLVSLIKPQFEVGKADLVKGRVKTEAALERACASVRAAIEAQGWTVLGLIPSPILGGAGAREFLIAARHG